MLSISTKSRAMLGHCKERQELADIKILEAGLQRTRKLFQSIADDESQPGITRVAAAREDRDTQILMLKIRW